MKNGERKYRKTLGKQESFGGVSIREDKGLMCQFITNMNEEEMGGSGGDEERTEKIFWRWTELSMERKEYGMGERINIKMSVKKCSRH